MINYYNTKQYIEPKLEYDLYFDTNKSYDPKLKTDTIRSEKIINDNIYNEASSWLVLETSILGNWLILFCT